MTVRGYNYLVIIGGCALLVVIIDHILISRWDINIILVVAYCSLETKNLGKFKYLVICQGTLIRKQRSDLFGLRVKLLSPITT